MRQIVTFAELSNDVNTKGTGSMCVVTSKSCNLLQLSSVVLQRNMAVNLLHGKSFGSGTTN
jgi:hypothetical protein